MNENTQIERANPFAVVQQQNQVRSGTDMMISRQAQEVQAAMVIAKKFPRDEVAAFDRIMKACKRKTLAEVAIYTYPRGGTQVEGPSIRLAEALAQAWGNVDFGIIELEQKDGESSVMAYAWDLETNTRQQKIFTVRHERTKNDRQSGGKIKTILDDPRDIYEMNANQGARRLRSCILGVIPGDVVDAAVNECQKTMSSGNAEPLIDRIKKMVVAFGDHGVTQAMIEARLGHKLDATTEAEVVQLRKIYTSLKDGMAKREDYFTPEASKPNFSKADEKEESDAGLAPSTKNYLKGVRGLMDMAKVKEADVLEYLRATGKIDDALNSLEEINMVKVSALEWTFDNWQEVERTIKKTKGAAK